MSKKKKITEVDYLLANRAANREIEMERNGGHWTAINRPHKNKKKYDRKRDRKLYPFDFCIYA
jgi:hypothetical protein